MPNRITGLASGVDIDELVKAELSTYKSKIAKQQQSKDVLSIKQDLYRDIITQGSDFHSKYFDLLKDGNLSTSAAYATTVFSSTNEKAVTAKAVSGSAIKDNYEVSVNRLAKPASAVVKLSDFESAADKKITIKVGNDPDEKNNKSIEIDLNSIFNSSKKEEEKNSDFVSLLNSKLKSAGLKAAYSDISGGVIISSEKEGKNEVFTIKDSSDKEFAKGEGVDCEYSIKSSTSNGVKTFTSSSNSVTKDGINFTFTTTTSEPVIIAGKTDVSQTVDKLTDFISDYNTMLTNFQTKLLEKHNRNYSPLTDDQRSEMKENEITKWEEKVKEGQLHNDNLVQSFVNQMRSSFSARTAELKKIGIETTDEYGAKAGNLVIKDKKKLESALMEDPEAVMKLFIGKEETREINGKKETISGVFTSLKNVLNDNTISSTKSALIKRAGTSLASSNATITKEINKYAKTITEMQSTLASKEQKLYSKYSKLETAMNKYNNQLSSLQSYFQ